MRPMASRVSLPPIRNRSTALAIALVVGSVIAAVGHKVQIGPLSLHEWLILFPDAVVSYLAVWQPLTYAFIETSPLGVIFGALILWSVGGALEQSWGRRRFLRFALGVPIVSGFLTVALMWAIGHELMTFAGGTVMTTGLWVALGLFYGRAQTNFWGLPISGNGLALIGVGFVLLEGIMVSPIRVVPSIFGILVTTAYMKLGTPRVLWLKFQSWRLQRQLKGRAKHLRLISKERNTPNDSDRYLH
jgi:membrane associated rhomboid family serine protease